jgi:GAF domain-containing protein
MAARFGAPAGPLRAAARAAMTDQAALQHVLTDFALLLVREYAVSDALHDLVDGVQDVLGVSGAGVSLAEDDRITFATAAPQRITVLERVQEATQAGPCQRAHATGQPVLIADITQDSAPWPELAAAAAEAGIVAIAGIPMHLNGTRLGALDLYHDAAHEWTDDEVAVAQLLAGMATACIANASRLDHIQNTNLQLQEALESRIIIEQAKGIIAGERNISVDQAFTLLRSHARSNQAPLRSIADAVVNLGLRP